MANAAFTGMGFKLGFDWVAATEEAMTKSGITHFFVFLPPLGWKRWNGVRRRNGSWLLSSHLDM